MSITLAGGGFQNRLARVIALMRASKSTRSSKSMSRLIDPMGVDMGLGWAGLSWAGLGWAWMVWAGLTWAGLGWADLGWAGLCWAGLGWDGLRKQAICESKSNERRMNLSGSWHKGYSQQSINGTLHKASDLHWQGSSKRYVKTNQTNTG